MALPVENSALYCPPLDDVVQALSNGLGENFADVQVSVVECPDLTQKPFGLAAPGLCGSARLADIGGVPYMFPLAQRHRIYNFNDIAELVNLPGAAMIGAGAGPAHLEGCNCEMMPNIKTSSLDDSNSGVYNSYLCKVNPQTGKYILKQTDASCCCVLMNLYVSEGKPGKVIQVKAGNRTGNENFVSCLRLTLQKYFGERAVGLGGTFLLEKGKARLHVMPDFSTVPLHSDEDVDGWLKFYEMSSPLVCNGYVVSSDPGLDLRVEHFHCFSNHGDGGHYHEDTTPSDAKYLGYFNLAEIIYRIDRPVVTHNYGRF